MPRASLRRARIAPAAFAFPLATVALLFASCSGGESEASATQPATSNASGGPPPSGSALEPTPIRVVAPERARTRPERLADAYDQERDEWESESLAVRIEERLASLDAWLRSSDTQAPAGFADAGYAGSALWPQPLEETRSTPVFVLRRWTKPDALESPARFEGPAGLARSLAELRDGLRAAGEGAAISTQFQVVGVDRTSDAIEARVLYSGWARAAKGAVEQEATWLCRFAPEGELAARGIELEAYQDGRLIGHRAIYEDCTASVLGADPTFEPQVVQGIDHWLPRIPSLVGMTNIGHHGFALGDVNGDGLEDLYVCDDGGLPNRLYVQQPDGTLRDTSAEAGVDFLDHSSAALLVDLDGDGDEDLVVAMRALLVFAQNNGDGRFSTRVRIPIGVGSMSLSAADYDSDGDLDVYCCMYNAGEQTVGIAYPYNRAENGAPNLFVRNAGGFRFVDATEESGLGVNNTRFSFAGAWEDYDDDGDQDLYVANDFGRNNLYRNDGGHFTDVALESGAEDVASGMSACWGDFDRNGEPDVYVGNLFSPAGLRVTQHDPFAAGKAMDTVMDVRRMARGNTLYAAQADGRFRDVSLEAGVNRGRWAWASPFVDLDGDGWEDLVVANGYYTFPDPRDLDSFFWRHVVYRSPKSKPSEQEIEEYRDWWLAMTALVKRGRSYNGYERNCAFLNRCDGTFAEVSALAGLDFPEDARSIAITDWDGDGDLDLWLRNRSAPRLRLLSNQLGATAEGGSFVAFHLRGTSANRDAIGARVEVELADEPDRPLRRSLQAGTGFLGQSSKWLHFGLAPGARIADVRVRWPGGDTERFGAPEPGKRYTLVQGSGRAVEWTRPGGAIELAPQPMPRPKESNAAAVFLAAHFPAPILRCVREGDAQPSAIEPGPGPRLVVLWAPGSKPSVESLDALARRADELRAAGLDVLALDASPAASPLDGARDPSSDAGRARIDRADFPFRRGNATPELLDKIALVQEFLFDIVPTPCLPLGLLLDGEGELGAIYRGGPDPDVLLKHVAALDAPLEQRYELAMPIPGRWKIHATDVGELTAANWFVERYPEDAERYYQRALAAGSANDLSMEPGGADAAKARALARLAKLRLSEKKVDDAIGLLEQSIALDAKQPEPLRDLGDAELFRGRFDSAIGRYRAAIELDPRLASAYMGLGNASRAGGHKEEAIAAFRQVLEIAPEDAPANHELGMLLFERNELDEAATCFERVIANDPQRGSAHYLLGAIQAARGDREGAQAQYRRAMELDPASIDVHLGRGESYLNAGRVQDALDHFELVLERRPDSAQALLRRAQARARLGDKALALADCRRAAELAKEPALRDEAVKLLAELQ